jgi:AcrR family transcriptional regulator
MKVRRNLKKGENTRRRMMDAARLVFLRDGYLNAEISEIARAAGNSAGAFYIYFENKSSILDALLDEFDLTLSKERQAENKYFQSQTLSNLRERILAIWETYKMHASAFYALAQASMVDTHFAQRERELRERAVYDIRKMIKARKRLALCEHLNVLYTTQSLEIMLTHTLHDWLAVRRSQFQSAAEEMRAFDSVLNIFSTVLELQVHVGKQNPRKPTKKRLR